MAAARASLVLYSRKDDPRSHAVRIVLAEKALDVDIVDVNPARPPEDLLDLNPYHEVPTFADRELAVYDMRVLFEYLEERHPHPPLWPLEPTQRARLRLALSRIDRDWFSLEAKATAARADGNAKAIAAANRDLREAVLAATPLFRRSRSSWAIPSASLTPRCRRCSGDCPCWVSNSAIRGRTSSAMRSVCLPEPRSAPA